MGAGLSHVPTYEVNVAEPTPRNCAIKCSCWDAKTRLLKAEEGWEWEERQPEREGQGRGCRTPITRGTKGPKH